MLGRELTGAGGAGETAWTPRPPPPGQGTPLSCLLVSRSVRRVLLLLLRYGSGRARRCCGPSGTLTPTGTSWGSMLREGQRQQLRGVQCLGGGGWLAGEGTLPAAEVSHSHAPFVTH